MYHSIEKPPPFDDGFSAVALMGFRSSGTVSRSPRENGRQHQSGSWQGLADEFGTFDWPAIHRELPIFPRAATRLLGWA